jgi:hypothetical protein
MYCRHSLLEVKRTSTIPFRTRPWIHKAAVMIADIASTLNNVDGIHISRRFPKPLCQPSLTLNIHLLFSFLISPACELHLF